MMENGNRKALMEVQDQLDQLLYQCLPDLDRAMQRQLEKEEKERPAPEPSRRFKRRMNRLIRRERQSEKEKQRGDAANQRNRRFSGKRVLAAALILAAVMALTFTVAASIFRKIRVTQYRDEVQGADVYRFSSERGQGGELVVVYPAYVPEGYTETEKEYREKWHYLTMMWENAAGESISYRMYQFIGGSSFSIMMDAEYTSSETVEINGLEWFCTFKEGQYRMARAQTGDLFFLISTPDTLLKEELLRILEGIEPPGEQAVGQIFQKEGTEELHQRVKEIKSDAKEQAEADLAAQNTAAAEEGIAFIRENFPDYCGQEEILEKGIWYGCYLEAYYQAFQTPAPEDAVLSEEKNYWMGRLAGEIAQFAYVKMDEDQTLTGEWLATLEMLLGNEE